MKKTIVLFVCFAALAIFAGCSRKPKAAPSSTFDPYANVSCVSGNRVDHVEFVLKK
jgi:hypothetical protein